MGSRRQVELRAFTRAVALAVALGIGAAPLAGAMHAAEQAHAVCPVHGELVHVGSADDLAESREPVRVVPRRPRAGERHSHCDVLSRGREQRTVQRAPAAMAPALQGRAGPTRVFELANTAGAPLRYAPKTSPPTGHRSFG